MANKTRKRDSSGATRGRKSARNEQKSSSSTQDPAEGKRDIGWDGNESADTNTGHVSEGHAPQQDSLSTEEPAEGDRRSAEE
jgi:hypothetical protein